MAGTGLVGATIGVAFVHINRTQSNEFGPASWTSVWFPGSSTTTSDTVYQNYLLGVYEISGVNGLNGYVANIP